MCVSYIAAIRRRNLVSLAFLGIGLAVALAIVGAPASAAAEGDPERGKRAFLKCVMCHSAEPGTHKTGPSLARVWGREAATVEGFSRYSDALEDADVVWNAATLDAWLRDPQAMVPGTSMRIRGIEDAAERRDLIAYLERLAAPAGATASTPPERPGMGMGMGMGMRGAAELEDLSAPTPEQQVVAIRYCADTYEVRTAAGRTLKFWEFNLRFKTDSSVNGPPQGEPALLQAGMRGDRAFVIFAAPGEISRFIDAAC